MSIPRRSFFANLIHYTDDDFHRERLREFIDPQYLDELYDYTTRPRRSILEVLDEFTSVKLPWQKVCSIIPVMRGRQFSIASGGILKRKPSEIGDVFGRTTNTENIHPSDGSIGTRFELLIAIVKYRTVIKRIRQGIATRYIASLLPGDRLAVSLQKGGLAVSSEQNLKPVVMVGPGTGVAPMRSLIYERLQQYAATNSSSPMLLFFGCRNQSADYYFHQEWERLEKGTSLQVFAAFSRDQRQKVYVQDLVRQQGDLVRKALIAEGGMVLVG